MQEANITRNEVVLTSEASGESYSAALWDPSNGSLISVFKNAGPLRSHTLQILSDCYVLGADYIKHLIHVWPLNNSSPVRNTRLVTPGKVSALTCTSDGSYIIVAVEEGLFIWQTCNGRLVGTLTGHLQTIKCLRTTKDDSLFASAGEDGLVFVWSLYSALNDKHCCAIHKFSDHTLPIGDLQFGYGGSRARLYTVSLDRSVNIYELGSGKRLLSIMFDMPLTVITVNICDSELFVGCITGDILQCNLHEPPRVLEKHVKIDSNDKDEVAIFRAHKSHVTALSVSVDCRTLMSGSTDRVVHIWDIISRQVLRTIEHKGAVTSAFFAPAYENFSVTTLKPRLQLHNLQQISDSNDDSVVEVITKFRDPMEILDYDSYVQDDIKKSQPEGTFITKIKAMKMEIEKLKKINSDLYQYTLANTLGNTLIENGNDRE